MYAQLLEVYVHAALTTTLCCCMQSRSEIYVHSWMILCQIKEQVKLHIMTHASYSDHTRGSYIGQAG